MPATPSARYYEAYPGGAVSCRLCPHECYLTNGKIGICGARKNKNGVLQLLTYGEITGGAVDPIEKKPLYHFFPGSKIFSVGGWGCNLKCVYCQNSAISQTESPTVSMSPGEVAKHGVARGSIGVAYTYNEPVIAIEYLIDCAKAVRKAGGKNVLVSNGYINEAPLEELLPLIDAINFDLKAFNNHFYKTMCGGKLEPVLDTIQRVVGRVHMELTTLVIPGENDAVPELEDLSNWILQHCGPDMPCHLSAYHPSYNYNKAATTEAHMKNARYIFSKKLRYVYIGNMNLPGASDTVCVNCGHTVVKRVVFTVDASGMKPNGACANCGAWNNIIAK